MLHQYLLIIVYNFNCQCSSLFYTTSILFVALFLTILNLCAPVNSFLSRKAQINTNTDLLIIILHIRKVFCSGQKDHNLEYVQKEITYVFLEFFRFFAIIVL